MRFNDNDLRLATQALFYAADVVFADDPFLSSGFRDLAVLVLNQPGALHSGQLNNICIALASFIDSSAITPADVPAARMLLKRFRSLIPPAHRNYK